MDGCLEIAGKQFRSRLLIGTGKYRSTNDMLSSVQAASPALITVAIRRLDLDNPSKKTILDHIDWSIYDVLPNTAGCRTAKEAVFVAKLGREVTNSNWVKLEVIPDPHYLFPDPSETLLAADELLQEGFVVLPYIHADPVLAKKLQDLGCATVMPLGSAIGSGQGIHTIEEIKIIIEQSTVPVIIDAGLGVPSDASTAMELGADAVLVNTAIALAKDPAVMAEAFQQGVEAGRKAYLSGRIPRKPYASASSPSDGMPNFHKSSG